MLSPSISFFVGTESWTRHVSDFPLRTGGHVCLQSPSGISFLSCDGMWQGETSRLLAVARNSWHWVAFTEEEMKHHARVYFCLGNKWSQLLTDRQQNGSKHSPSILQLSVNLQYPLWTRVNSFLLLAIYVLSRKDGRIALLSVGFLWFLNSTNMLSNFQARGNTSPPPPPKGSSALSSMYVNHTWVDLFLQGKVFRK